MPYIMVINNTERFVLLKVYRSFLGHKRFPAELSEQAQSGIPGNVMMLLQRMVDMRPTIPSQ
jgi:hypothetical protein